jgi:hypothetical protein
MKIKVHSDNNAYVLTDAAGNTYGRYDTKQEADAAASDWNNYYDEPLASAPDPA